LCNPATIVQPQVIPFGMTAFKKVALDGVNVTTETPFTPFILGPQSTNNLVAQCSAIGTRGICGNCQAGAQ
jgi:hypothetical protein